MLLLSSQAPFIHSFIPTFLQITAFGNDPFAPIHFPSIDGAPPTTSSQPSFYGQPPCPFDSSQTVAFPFPSHHTSQGISAAPGTSQMSGPYQSPPKYYSGNPSFSSQMAPQVFPAGGGNQATYQTFGQFQQIPTGQVGECSNFQSFQSLVDSILIWNNYNVSANTWPLSVTADDGLCTITVSNPTTNSVSILPISFVPTSRKHPPHASTACFSTVPAISAAAAGIPSYPTVPSIFSCTANASAAALSAFRIPIPSSAATAPSTNSSAAFAAF